MDINQLRSFTVVAESKSISEAAKKLFISHQALSKTIASLESELGVSLLERRPYGVSVTQYGELVVETAHAIERDLSILKKKILLLQETDKAMVRLGFSASLLVGEFLIRELVTLCKANGVHLTCSVMDDTGCLEGVVSAELDIAVIVSARLPQNDGMSVTGLCAVPCYLTIDKEMPFAASDELSTNDLALLRLPSRDVISNEVIGVAFAHAGLSERLKTVLYDSSAVEFSSHVHANCNATYVSATYVEAATSDTHTVRAFPPDGWMPTAYLIHLKERADERALQIAKKALVSKKQKIAHALDPQTTTSFLA